MKHLDELSKKILLFVCISAATITCLSSLHSMANQVSTLDHYRSALRQNGNIEDLLNQVAFKVYAENEMSKTGSTSYADVFFTEDETSLDSVQMAEIETNLREGFIESLDDIYNLSAVFIDNVTNKKTYFNKGSTIPIRLYEDEFENYSLWYKVDYDSDGNQTVTSVDTKISLNINPFVDTARYIKENYSNQEIITQNETDMSGMLTESKTALGLRSPEMKNCTLVFAIGTNFASHDDAVSYYISSYSDSYYPGTAEQQYIIMGVIAGLLGLVLSVKKVRESSFGPTLERQCWEIRLLIMFSILFMLFAPNNFLYQAMYEFRGNVGGIVDLTTGMMYAVLAFVSMAAIYLGIIISAYWMKTIFADGLKESWNKVRSKDLALKVLKIVKSWLYSLIQLQFSMESIVKFIGVLIANIVVLLFLIFMFRPFIATLIYTVLLAVIASKFMNSVRQDYQKLQAHTKGLANGDLTTEINSNLGIFEPLVEELENIRIGFKVAIDEETKSQVMKTELISNVSHDLKTPLTSLISYVDLMKKEKNAKKKDEYLETVERSSMRLKHLIDDLFEVSKANSGDIKLEIVDVDLPSLVNQTLFECKPQIEKSNLTFKTDYDKEKIMVPLDAHKTYRIIENVISNAIKYSVKNTRVYIQISEEDLDVVFSIRNVSSEEITFDPNDLVERFVRGDRSRNSEGSGLGLAIAKGFTEAQNGKLKIETDGDYFKVVITFRKKG